MNLALNEVGGMAVKAARGAGIPLGQAEDLGRIAIYLAGTSGDVRAITQALQEPLNAPDVQWGSGQITIHAGAAVLIAPIVRDAFVMGCDHATLADAAHAPFVAATMAEAGIALKWNGRTLARSDTTVVPAACKPVTIARADWDIWASLAAQTYVPESDASRLAGAGAGLNDND